MLKVRTCFIALFLFVCFLVPFLNQLEAQQFYHTAVATTNATPTTALQQLIAPVVNQYINIIHAGIVIGVGGTTGNTVQFIACTATGCPGGQVAISAAYSTGTGANSVPSINLNSAPVLAVPTGFGLFVASSAAVPYSVSVTYYQSQ